MSKPVPLRAELLIASRIAFPQGFTFSRFIIRIATVAVALSLAVMIIAGGLERGFQKTIEQKIYGFWGHIHITRYGLGNSAGTFPIPSQPFFMDELKNHPDISHVQSFANKAGILKSGGQIEGIILKGIGADFNWPVFKDYMQEGTMLPLDQPDVSDGIMISATTARRLALSVGDAIEVHFIQQPPRLRRLVITTIYHTGLEEYDKQFAWVDIRQIQQLNDWESHQIEGLEVFLSKPENMDPVAAYLFEEVLGHDMMAQTIREIFPNIFDWLQLQSMNKWIILILMITVAVINMVTCLLILILERTRMIGILKSIGADHRFIARIFWIQAAIILGRGMLLGNFLGLILLWSQRQFQWLQLPEASYYVKYAPVSLSIPYWIGLNVGTLLIALLILYIPTWVARHITPVRSLRFR